MPNFDSENIEVPNHKLLIKIAYFSNLFSWIAVGFYLISAVFNVYAKLSIDPNQFGTTISALLLEKPFYGISLVSNTLRWLLQGIILWLILKSVSLGLKMIVETNRNSLPGANGETHGR